MANARPLACIALGVLTIIAAIILLITSSVLVYRIDYISRFWQLFFIILIVSIVISSLAIIFTIGLLYVVQRRFPALTTLFSGLLTLIFIASATCGIILLVDRANIRSQSYNNTRRLFYTSYSNSTFAGEYTPVLDRIQQTYQCCGVDQATDWKVKWPGGAGTPDSCCRRVTTLCGNNSLIAQDKIYLRGCAEPMYAQFRTRYTTIIGMNFSLMILSLITAVLGLMFERFIRDQYQSM